MNIRFYIKQVLIGLFFISCLISCQKQAYENGFVSLAQVHFDASKAALNTTGSGIFLSAKYNGYPIDWKNGVIKVPEGEGTFEFYDNRTGEALAEKTISVSSANPESYLIFQPSVDAPLAFLDPSAQSEEEAAPEGFMKIKIANYATNLIPFEKVDIVLNFRYQVGRQYEYLPMDTIEAVSQNLDVEDYRLVRKGEHEANYNPGYYCSFMDSETKETIKNAGGTTYFTHVGITPDNVKDVFTLFLTPVDYIQNTLYIENNGLYYYINLASVF